jgi:hypothetical protein
MSPTVQGVCADCWGSKGGRQFWLSNRAPSAPHENALFDTFSPFVIGAVVAAVPAVVVVLLWLLA